MYFENQEPASKSKIYTAVLFAALLSVRYQSINHICYSKSSPAFFLSEPLSIKRIKTNTKKKSQTKTIQNQNSQTSPPSAYLYHVYPVKKSVHCKAHLHCTISWGFPSQSTAPPANPSSVSSPSAHSPICSSTTAAPHATTERSDPRKASEQKPTLIKLKLQWNHTRCSSHGSHTETALNLPHPPCRRVAEIWQGINCRGRIICSTVIPFVLPCETSLVPHSS